MLAAATPPPTVTPVARRDPTARVGRGYTLVDASLALPPLALLAPDLVLLPPAPAPTPALREADTPIDWQLRYRRAQLGQLPGSALRSDPPTGFSRQLDTDVLTLGMAWRLAGNRVGLAYQLQSARGRSDDVSLSRFLPGSDTATHALTVGVTREFGAGQPPPAPPPLLVAPAPAPPSDPPTTPSPVP